MKKAIIIGTITFLATVLIPLISLSNIEKDENVESTSSQSETKMPSDNELVTIFN